MDNKDQPFNDDLESLDVDRQFETLIFEEDPHEKAIRLEAEAEAEKVKEGQKNGETAENNENDENDEDDDEDKKDLEVMVMHESEIVDDDKSQAEFLGKKDIMGQKIIENLSELDKGTDIIDNNK